MDSIKKMNDSDIVYIDDCFYVEEKYSMWMSTLRDGEKLVTSLSKQLCIDHTRFYLKGRQEGWGEEQSRVVNDGVVGGKL